MIQNEMYRVALSLALNGASFSGVITMKSHHVVLWVCVCMASLWLCSCAGLDSVTKTVGLSETDERPQRFYVGRDGLPLFPEPRFCKTRIAALPLHEQVVRDRLENGFAHVKVVKTGQTGWVNNAHLLWRIPPSPKASAGEAVPSPGPMPASAVPPPEPLVEEQVQKSCPPEQDMIQQPSHPHPEIEGRDAAIFNRF